MIGVDKTSLFLVFPGAAPAAVVATAPAVVVPELPAGILIGPHALGWAGTDELIGSFSNLGLSMLFYFAGQEVAVLDPDLSAVGFGFLIPFPSLFIDSGMTFDLGALGSTGANAKLLMFFALFLLARGGPALPLHHDVLDAGQRRMPGLYSATGLPLVVAITILALEAGRMDATTSASLVGAAILSTLIFPLGVMALGRIPATCSVVPAFDRGRPPDLPAGDEEGLWISTRASGVLRLFHREITAVKPAIPSPKTKVGSLIELVVIVAVALGLALAIQAWIVKPYRIPTGSMEPTLEVGQRILVDRFILHFEEPKIGDIVVFHPPVGADSGSECAVLVRGMQPLEIGEPCPRATAEESSQTFVKRIVAVGGDTLSVKEGHPVVDGVEKKDEPYIDPCRYGPECDLPKTIQIPPGYFFMMGDNRGESDDSRYWGPVPESWIIGEAFATYWPPDRLGAL